MVYIYIYMFSMKTPIEETTKLFKTQFRFLYCIIIMDSNDNIFLGVIQTKRGINHFGTAFKHRICL